MSVFDVCRIKVPKAAVAVLLCISAAVFIPAASSGYCDWYYKDVALQIVDGTARLVKVYGKLHIVYFFYLFVYFSAMISTVVYVIVKKKITSHKYASMLTAVVFLNILIWLLEQLIPVEFEFLSISYIASEIILLFLFSIMNDFDELKNAKHVAETAVSYATVLDAAIAADEPRTQMQEAEAGETGELVLSEHIASILEQWQLAESLTSREVEVLTLILDNCRRKEIADRLCLSENTVKTHTSHIFTKLGVAGRSELIEKANRMLSVTPAE